MKKIKLSALIIALSFIFIMLISCGAGIRNSRNLGKHSYLYSSNIQDDASNIKVKMGKITRNDIRKVPVDLPSHFKSKMVAGGYGELRHFYPIDNTYHLGIDVFAKPGTKIVAPANAEVITAIWRHGKSTNNFAHGSGGNLLLRVNINDLDIEPEYKKLIYVKYYIKQKNYLQKNGFREETYYSAIPKMVFLRNHKFSLPNGKKISETKSRYETLSQVNKIEYDQYINTYQPKNSLEPTKKEVIDSPKYLYISFMHLSKASIEIYGDTKVLDMKSEQWNVSKKININGFMKKVKKGQTIGFVGNANENGGWATHTHVEAHFASLNKYQYLSLNKIHGWFSKKKKPLFGTGTTSFDIQKYGDFETFAAIKGIIDPNNIYKFYDGKTPEREVLIH